LLERCKMKQRRVLHQDSRAAGVVVAMAKRLWPSRVGTKAVETVAPARELLSRAADSQRGHEL
jgi:hypothetical protein